MRVFQQLIACRWLFVAVGLLFFFFRSPRLYGWDESFYVAQVASFISDQDLFLQDELLWFPNEFLEIFRSLTIILPGGALQNTFSFGPALFWFPVTAFLPQKALDPCGITFQNAVAIESLIFAIIFILLMFDLLRKLGASTDLSGWTIVGIYASGPLALYGTRFLLNTHLLSAMLSAALLMSTVSLIRNPTRLSGIGFGLLAGGLTLNRWQDILIPIVLSICVCLVPREDNADRKIFRSIIALLFGLPLVLLVLGLQFAVWKIQFNSWLLMPQGKGFMLWTAPAFIPFLVSGFHGFIPWAPGVFFGYIGLFLPRHAQEPRMSRLLLVSGRILVPLSVYVSAASFDWWSGASFGPRRLSSMIPFAAVGLMRLLFRMPRALRFVFIPFLLAWSLMTMAAYTKNLDDLTMLLTGHPDPYTQHHPDMYKSDHWQNMGKVWADGVRKLLKPGFTLTHTPDDRDRLIGFGIVCVSMGGVLLAGRQFRRHRSWRLVATAISIGFIGTVMGWLVFICPSNHIWNQSWLGILHGAPIEDAPIPFPEGAADAAHLIQGIRWFYLGDMESTYRSINRISKSHLDTLNFNEVVDFVQDPANHAMIESRLWIREDEREIRRKNLLTFPSQ